MKFFFFLLLIPSFCFADTRSLYNSLDPKSLTQYLAFYQLYPESTEGKEALAQAWKLLKMGSKTPFLPDLLLPTIDIEGVVALITREPHDPPIHLGERELKTVSDLSSHFANRKLKGSQVWTKEEVLSLPVEEIDLARGLLIEQFDNNEDPILAIRQYEASLDLMALQIYARLPEQATHFDKIREINKYIFQEMQFRFPPHSLYAKDIDLYTFLPSVLDSRQGVCLGVSILYLSLAQRLDLPLEIVTPPGHIYVRYNDGTRIINIETTARGINPPCEIYLGLNTRKLQMRNLKEVIGMAFVNQASVFWTQSKHEKCIELYEKGLPYLQGDRLIEFFLGLNYLFVGRTEEGTSLLTPLKGYIFDYAVAPDSIPEDFLSGHTSIEAMKTIFLPVDETRESIVQKLTELQEIVKQFPKFRAGILQLAIAHLQLGRAGEAFEVLQRYHKLDPRDPTVEYYLSIVAAERRDYNQAWHFLHTATGITEKRGHQPRALRSLKAKLRTLSPDPVY